MEPQVSVIIPVYNASEFISRCCDALFSQTLQSIEYIFVDDGSSDESVCIINQALDKYPARRNQVVFVSYSDNRGVGVARNAGIKRATGEYIIHCDSDDWVEPNFCEILYFRAKETNADIVTCGYYVDAADGTRNNQTPPLVNTDPLLFSISPQTGALWTKLIRRGFLEEHHLEVPLDINWGEDLCLSLESLLLSQNTQSINEILYHHVLNEDSLTYSVSVAQCLDLVKCGSVVENFLKEHSLQKQYSSQLNWLKFQLKQYLLIFPQSRDIQLWRSIYPECHHDIFQYETMTYLQVSSWLIVHHFELLALFLLRLRDILSNFKNR